MSMTTGPGREITHTVQRGSDARLRSSLATFPTTSTLENEDQVRRFELLRLAFFVLKLRKLEQRLEAIAQEAAEAYLEHELSEQRSLLTYRCNLLRHVIFQQVLALIDLNARDQAMQIISTCRR